MATAQAQDEAGYIGLNDDGIEWETVHVEAPDQVLFDVLGDTFSGVYDGSEEIDPKDEKDPDKRFTQLKFHVEDNHYVINAGYELAQAFATIDQGSTVRIRLVKLVNVGQASPMKSFRVDVAKKSARAGNTGK
jgi:hypothetical protein